MKHRALIVGAGRIGAGYNWHDDAYTHAGAYRANKDQVKLVGFVETDLERRVKANLKWKLPTYDNLASAVKSLNPTILSICTQPEDQTAIITEALCLGVKTFYCEKPYMGPLDLIGVTVQVNYMRRGDVLHQKMKEHLDYAKPKATLFVIGKDDLHTRCHFEDLSKWWGCELVYLPYQGPNSYFLRREYGKDNTHETLFSLGGVNGGECMKAMVANLLDHVTNGVPLWSPER